jgi:dGTPase
MEIREELEIREESLNPKASKSKSSKRIRKEEKSSMRTEFQRDRDRILHSKSFRRLKHKTQVFISPGGDHFRTRLTHTLEVSQISRTIAKALNLNEDLTEAIALAHDLGHTPFGHTGEEILDGLSDEGFRHYEQSLRVVDKLEYNGKGLNLTIEVRDGILKHSKGIGPVIPEDKDRIPFTLEGQIVRISDIVAYVNHDIDDALRAEIITRNDIPSSITKTLGKTFAKRIDTIVTDIIYKTLENNLEFISVSDGVYNEVLKLRDFLFKRVYKSGVLEIERRKVNGMLHAIFSYVNLEPEKFINQYPEGDSINRRIIDFIAGMTDNYALNLFKLIALPRYMY